MKRIVYYTNQFFGQMGGEDKADLTPVIKEGPIGPAVKLDSLLEKGTVTATVLCGDNYYAAHMEEARSQILKELMDLKPDLIVAGPAFNAGRFGIACADIAAAAAETLSVEALTAMYEENPALEIYRHRVHILQTGKTAASMGKALDAMAALADRLLAGETLDDPEKEGLFPKGIRVNVFREKTGAERALDLLVAKLKGEPCVSEIPLPTYDRVNPAPGVADLKQSVIALVTSGGIVPENNPDRLPAATAKHYCRYDISGVEALSPGTYESVHAGYDPVAANLNPNRIVPLDLMREMEREGRIGSLYPFFYSTTGNSTSVADATRMGREIAAELKKNKVDAVLMTST